MSEPHVTVLREIRDDPNAFSLYVIASWCNKAADEIERLQAEKKDLEVHWYNEGKRVANRKNKRLRAALEQIMDETAATWVADIAREALRDE